MTGADFFIFAVIGFMTWAGGARGVVKEIFEFLIVTAGPLFCTQFFGPATDFLTQYCRVPPGQAAAMGFLIFLLPVTFALWIVAGKLEARANLGPSNEWNQSGGLLFAFLKSVTIVWLILFVFSRVPMADNGRKFFNESFSVKTLELLNPYMDQAIYYGGSFRTYQYLHPRIQEMTFKHDPTDFNKPSQLQPNQSNESNP